MILNRREWLLSLTSLASAATWRDSLRTRVEAYLEKHKRSEGGYGWETDVIAHTTPTFAAVGCYHVLGMAVPDLQRVASSLRRYPVPERRRTERPLWRLDWEQVQALVWLRQPVDDFTAIATTWTRPAEFPPRYELGANPVFQHQALAIRTRALLGLASEKDVTWREYLAARRRPNGTFNHTPASDGTGGHLLNTLWGVWASRDVGLVGTPDATWIRRCQRPSGGFTYSPDASGEDIAYTWAALHLLNGEIDDREACARFIASLSTEEGGFQDAPGGEPNPLATFYALDALRILNQAWKPPLKLASRASRPTIPAGARVYSIQIQAPGQGSPSEAVEIAEALGIHLWTAKNSQPGWIDEANRIAGLRKASVSFHSAGEDYGTYLRVPGLGTYSHLVDWAAEADPGEPMPKKEHPYSLDELREARFRQLRRARGTLVWQFLENEELTRVLLDGGDYQAIASFHFGNENFLHSQPYLMRWAGRMPYVSLQDAHARESWWWTDMLSGFTTLFVAKQPGWSGWMQALQRNHVVCVRHDAVTNWKTHWAGGTPEARAFVQEREKEWRWWDDTGRLARRPAAALTVLGPSARFEAGAPTEHTAVRLRLWADNTGQGLPREPRVELVSFHVDGKPADPQRVETKDDRYLLQPVTTRGEHHAVAHVRVVETGVVKTIEKKWNS